MIKIIVCWHSLQVCLVLWGTLSFCVEEAVKEVGGESNLFDGDIIIYNNPYGSGSHSQDVAIVKPVYLEKKLIGYTAIKAHWLDTGGKNLIQLIQ